MIQKTKDYSIFKTHKSNRDHDNSLLKKLELSILSKNLLQLRPILVNSKMEVIDGQHRLKVAEKLKIDIWYEVNEKLESEDIVLINNQKQWGLVDYFNYFENEGYEEYEKLGKYMRNKNLTISKVLILLYNSNTKEIAMKIRKGTYKYPEDSAIQESEEKLVIINAVIEYIKGKTVGLKSTLKGSMFMHSLLSFFAVKSICPQIFFKKLPYKMDLIHPCSRRNDYIMIFKEIYNYKNPEPIRRQDLGIDD